MRCRIWRRSAVSAVSRVKTRGELAVLPAACAGQRACVSLKGAADVGPRAEPKHLLLAVDFMRRLLDLHLELVDEVERELSAESAELTR